MGPPSTGPRKIKAGRDHMAMGLWGLRLAPAPRGPIGMLICPPCPQLGSLMDSERVALRKELASIIVDNSRLEGIVRQLSADLATRDAVESGLRSENTGLRSLVAAQRERLRHAVRGSRRPAPAALPRQPHSRRGTAPAALPRQPRRHCRARRGDVSAAAPPRRHRHRHRRTGGTGTGTGSGIIAAPAAEPLPLAHVGGRAPVPDAPVRLARAGGDAQGAPLQSRPTCRRPRRGAGRPRPAGGQGAAGPDSCSLTLPPMDYRASTDNANP